MTRIGMFFLASVAVAAAIAVAVTLGTGPSQEASAGLNPGRIVEQQAVPARVTPAKIVSQDESSGGQQAVPEGDDDEDGCGS